MRKNGVKAIYNARLKGVKTPKKSDGNFILKFDYNTLIKAKKVILATGGHRIVLLDQVVMVLDLQMKQGMV